MANRKGTDQSSLGKSNRRGKPIEGTQRTLFLVSWDELGRTRDPSVGNLVDRRGIIKVNEYSQHL